MAIVGPGSVKQDTTNPIPTLDSASEYEYVTIYNPLPDDFQINVAQDVPVNMPFALRDPTTMTQSESDIVKQYGLQLKNPDHKAKKYIYNQAIIPAGGTMNFKGNEAQVVVRQLVNEILQRGGKRRLMSDPTLRREVEEQIIQKRGSVQDILDDRLVTPRQQIDEALNKSNEVTHEPFPGLEAIGGTSQKDSSAAERASDNSELNSSSKKPVGRPKKANS